MRTVIAGVLGGIAMFLCTSICHIATPLGETGIGQIANAAPLFTVMTGTLGNTSGLYLYPGLGKGPQAMARYDAALATGPSGLLVYHPPGGRAAQVRQFGVEFLTELAEAMLAAFLLAQTTLAGYGARVTFVAGVGVAAAITTNLSYWNWYGFPTSYTLALSTIEFLGFVAAGLVIALVLRKSA